MSKISVDAGHGGRDSGAVGPTGLKESIINLGVAQQLAGLLRTYNYQVQMIRNTDVFVEIGERARLANNWHANHFVSIHCNSNGPTANGIETLYRTGAGKELADPIQNALIKATGEINRGLKQRTNLGVLNATQMPAVLIEIGFISHRPTEDRLRTNGYLTILSNAICVGIVNFLGDTVVTTPIIPAPPSPVKKVTLDLKTPSDVKVDIIINNQTIQSWK